MFRYFNILTILTIFCLLTGTVLWGQQRAAAVSYPDPPKSFTQYPVSFTVGRTITASSIPLSGAQNEDFLLIFVLKNADISNLSVTLTRPNPTYMTIRVYQLRPAPANLADTYYADGMVPLDNQSLTLPGNPVYLAIGLKINKVHPAGTYKYTLTFTNGSSVVNRPLSVSVWPFALPDDLPITILGNGLYNSGSISRYGVSATDFYNKVYPAYLNTMRQYKMNSLSLTYPLPANDVASGAAPIESSPDFTGMLDTIAKYGFRYFRLPNLTGVYDATKIDQPGNLFAFNGPVYYQAWYNYLLSKGWSDRAIVKTWDEPTTDQYPLVEESYDIVKSAVPQFATLCTGNAPDTSLSNAVNIWTVYARRYNAQADATARSLGQQVWLYANNLHNVKRNATNQRIIGWHLFRYNFSGYFIWAINNYPGDPWTTQPDPTSRSGAFIYPNPLNGMPLPTLRLEALRRGFEDYQYFALLQQAYQNGKVRAAAYNGIMGKIAYATSRLTTDSVPYYWKDMENVRQAVGKLLKSAQ